MRDGLGRGLQRLLPQTTGRELFEPAWRDLRIVHLRRRARGRTRFARVGLDWWHAVLVLALFADCWRLTLTDTDRLHHKPKPTTNRRPRRERLSMLLYNLRHAFRRLLREPGFTTAAVLTLALGVGANLAVFAVVEAVLLRPLPYEDADRLLILNHRDQRTGITKEFIAIGDYVDIATRQSSFESLGAYGSFQATIFGQGEPYQVSALLGTAELLAALRIRPLLGRGLLPEDALTGAGPVVLLGYDLWRTRFGSDSSVVGRSITVGAATFQVVGVAPPAFRFPRSPSS